MNALRRLFTPHLPAAAIDVPDKIDLRMESANCHCYDYLLWSANVDYSDDQFEDATPVSDS